MKERSVLFSLLTTCVSILSYAQMGDCEYKVNMNSKTKDCLIHLYDDNNFFISLSEDITDDIISELVLSYGHLKLHGDTVLLTDSIYGYSLLFLQKKEELLPLKSFPFMQGIPIVLYSEDYSEKLIWNRPRPTLNEIRNEVENHKKNTSSEDCFRPCKYKYEKYLGSSYIIDFMQNGFYSIKAGDVLLSQGEWNKDRNVVYLNDEGLGTTFFLLIEGGMLVGKSLPCYYDRDVVLEPILSPYKSLKEKNKKPNQLFHRLREFFLSSFLPPKYHRGTRSGGFHQKPIQADLQPLEQRVQSHACMDFAESRKRKNIVQSDCVE